jgi:general secretion pathway protein M
MRAWWEERAPRERRITAFALFAAALTVLFLFGIEPVLERRAALGAQLQALVNDQAWMEAQAPAVRARMQAGATRVPTAPSGGRSPLAVVDASARAAGLGAALRRVRPLETAVEAELEDAPYTVLVRWLGALEGQHGLRIASVGIDRGAEPGRVNVQLRIEPATDRP